MRYAEYKIIDGAPHSVETRVNDLMRDGWHLIGSPSYSSVGSFIIVCQAMGKPVTPKPCIEDLLAIQERKTT